LFPQAGTQNIELEIEVDDARAGTKRRPSVVTEAAAKIECDPVISERGGLVQLAKRGGGQAGVSKQFGY
jgi:hypothetical protein